MALGAGGLESEFRIAIPGVQGLHSWSPVSDLPLILFVMSSGTSWLTHGP